MKTVVLDGYTLNPGDNPWDEVAALGELVVYDRTAPGEVVPRASGATVVLTNKTPITAEMLARLPDLKMISVLATGYNIVDVAAAAEKGMVVCNVPVYGTDSVAQYVFAAILHVMHDLGRHDAAIRDGHWQRSGDFSFTCHPLHELAGRTLGIVGFGRIGRRTAEIGVAFGMRVIATSRSQSNAPPWSGFRWCSLAELFADSDIVSLHCPQTASNQGFVNRELLGVMKPNAILVNSARGALVDEAALAEALNEGRIAAAVLDVLSAEPVREDNPLLHARNCLLTPHLAWATVEARQRMMKTTAANIRGFQSGRPVNVVN